MAQKPCLDTAALNHWPLFRGSGISPDGAYVYYIIKNKPAGKSTLVLKSVKGGWQRDFLDIVVVGFSGNSQQFIYKSADSLCFLSLSTDTLQAIPGVSTWKQPKAGGGKWLAYQLKKDAKKTLILYSLVSGQEQSYYGITDYLFDDTGRVLVLKRFLQSDSNSSNSLVWVDLVTGTAKDFWSSDRESAVASYCLDAVGSQLAFIVQKKGRGGNANSLWYYRQGLPHALMKADSSNLQMGTDWSIAAGTPQFTSSGNCILFGVQRIESHLAVPNSAKINIWSYRDIRLQSEQLANASSAMSGRAAIAVTGDEVIPLLLNEGLELDVKGDFAIITRHVDSRFRWVDRKKNANSLLSLIDGHFIRLPYTWLDTVSVSPNSRWLVYFDDTKQQYYSCEMTTGKIRSITNRISTSFFETSPELISFGLIHAFGIAGWLADGSRILIYTKYDIWAIDPSGKEVASNITHGYGEMHRIRLRLLDTRALLSNGISVLLTAFDEKNYYNGFCRIILGKTDVPESMNMEPYISYVSGQSMAGDSACWLVQRQSPSKAPNYFLTHDFKSYQPLTDLQPQIPYNWLTAEFVHFTQLDGQPSEGILYKPEDFDLHKKYPVLFYYYEKLPTDLYSFPEPKYNGGPINIAWYVSRGYLVFIPAIYYRAGVTGRSAYNAVVAAAQYLAKRPYVDATKMGIQGHSFGAFETNYIVTHTHMFAAACSASGYADMISWYGNLWNQHGAEADVEVGQGRMGATLWQRPQKYIENSPVFCLDKVTTPLLLMGNQKDAVNYLQEIEFFLGLRRLNKKVWLLQYDEGGHDLSGIDGIDYTLRVTQFFDYYLKGALPANWMTRGIPAWQKGIEMGLELDQSGQNP